MKTLKLFILIALVSFSSCSKDDTPSETVETTTFQLAYDSSENSVSINGGEWLFSIDFETFVDADNFEPGESDFGVLENWLEFRIRVVSDVYELVSITTGGIYEGYYLENDALYIDIPELRDYIDNVGSIFYFEVQVKSLQ